MQNTSRERDRKTPLDRMWRVAVDILLAPVALLVTPAIFIIGRFERTLDRLNGR